MRTLSFIFLSLTFLVPSMAFSEEEPAVLLAYARKVDAGLCIMDDCEKLDEMQLVPMQGYWFSEPQKIFITKTGLLNNIPRSTPQEALKYDYTVQMYGSKQEVVSSFVKEDHKKLWTILERSYSTNKAAVRHHNNIKLLGYAVYHEEPEYMFAFVTYKNKNGEDKRRTFVFTLEDGILKRTFGFAVDKKEIYRVVDAAFQKGGEDFKAYKYDKKTGETIGKIEDIYHLKDKK